MSKIKLIVFDEWVLGYVLPEFPNDVQILHASILKGRRYIDHLASSLPIARTSKVRLASPKDFEDYRVLFTDNGYGNKAIYEYAES